MAHLVEVLADEAAVRVCRPARLALALIDLAGTGAPPAGLLAAGGSGTARRAWRLIDPPRRLDPARTVAIAAALLAAPVTAAAVPIAISVDMSNHQHVAGHDDTPA